MSFCHGPHRPSNTCQSRLGRVVRAFGRRTLTGWLARTATEQGGGEVRTYVGWTWWFSGQRVRMRYVQQWPCGQGAWLRGLMAERLGRTASQCNDRVLRAAGRGSHLIQTTRQRISREEFNIRNIFNRIEFRTIAEFDAQTLDSRSCPELVKQFFRTRFFSNLKFGKGGTSFTAIARISSNNPAIILLFLRPLVTTIISDIIFFSLLPN